MTTECDQLDTYLLGDLPSTAAARFETHLTDCTNCREAIAQQRWIDCLLRSDELASLEPVPSELGRAVRKSIVHRRQASRYAAYGLAAAATLAAVAAGWTLKLNRQADEVVNGNTDQVAEHYAPDTHDTHPMPTSNPSAPRATFTNYANTITVPLESSDDDVTIVQLYPTPETERRWRRELVLRNNFEPNGG